MQVSEKNACVALSPSNKITLNKIVMYFFRNYNFLLFSDFLLIGALGDW